MMQEKWSQIVCSNGREGVDDSVTITDAKWTSTQTQLKSRPTVGDWVIQVSDFG